MGRGSEIVTEYGPVDFSAAPTEQFIRNFSISVLGHSSRCVTHLKVLKLEMFTIGDRNPELCLSGCLDERKMNYLSLILSPH